MQETLSKGLKRERSRNRACTRGSSHVRLQARIPLTSAMHQAIRIFGLRLISTRKRMPRIGFHPLPASRQ